MNYKECVRYIDEIPKFAQKPTLTRADELWRKLGRPCEKKNVIHVAGTNGKGSACSYMQAILRSEGKNVGLFTSPHLVEMTERIQRNGMPVSEEVFVKAFRKVLSIAKEMEREGVGHPSYFEFLFGMGMLIFQEEKVEYVILETGLGGRLDATNAFPSPVMAVITSIGMDHMAVLGNTIEEIAEEKAGIIKVGVPVFYDGTNEKASRVIREEAKKTGAPAYEITPETFGNIKIKDKVIAFSMRDEYDNNTMWHVGGGLYQVMNATLSVRAMQHLLGKTQIPEGWHMAVQNMKWPGRMEEVLPGVFLDGAHNLPAIRAFVEDLQARYQLEPGKKIVILFTAMADKDYRHMIQILCEGLKGAIFVVTQLSYGRCERTDRLSAVFREYTDSTVMEEESLCEAMKTAMEQKGADGVLYCLGSLYLVGEWKRLLGGSHA